MKKCALLILILLSFKASAQKEANNWFFGRGAGIRFLNDGSVQPLPGSQMNTNEGCSSISDSSGNLLFYTDGRNVWDRNHVLMPNGDYVAGTGLLGDPSSTQSAIIVPKKNNPDIYYIFTVDEPHNLNASVYPNQFTGFYTETETVPGADDGFNNGLNYSVVDLSLTGANGSVGDIVTRNLPLRTYNPDNVSEASYKCSEKVTAVKNKNGSGFWVVTQFTDKFYSFLVNENGVTEAPVITQINPLVPVSGYRRNAIGCIKASPDGKYIAIAHEEIGTVTGGKANNGVVYLYNFDNATGIVSSPVLIASDVNPYGVEFSPKAKKLYVSYDVPGEGFGGEVHQYNLLSTDITASDILIYKGNTATTLQLGPNGKIYKAVNGGNNLDVINYPEEDGLSCNYQPAGVFLQPDMMSIFGLPPFITSLFSAAIIAENLCFNDVVSFSLDVSDDFDSVTWDFGDGTTSTERTPEHQYKIAQIYTITANIVRDGETEIVTDDVTIAPLPPDVQNAVLVQCGLSNGGIAQFNLSQADTQFTAGNSNFTVTYFTTSTDASNNLNAVNAFTNTTNPQVINARVTNKATGCYRILPLTLSVNFTAVPAVTLKRCDDDGTEDGLAFFDLALANVDGGGNPVSYYPSGTDALLEQNEIADINKFANTTPNQQSIYARIESDNACSGLQEIVLIVNPLPDIKVTDSATVCVNTNEYISINAATTGDLRRFEYLWSTGATTRAISINEPGVYTVEITDNSDNDISCSKIRTITVEPSDVAIIDEVIIEDLRDNNTVTVKASPTGGVATTYLYSIDQLDGPWQDSAFFENVTPGLHTVYVYEPNGCGVVKKQISVLSIPKYFTPNGDNSHDYWQVKGINAAMYNASKIYIFDRYGKLVADVDPNGPGWDGQFKGRQLPSTDYWYQLLLSDGRTVKGHLSLVR
jgi:gliding motility-associated-like protein